MFAAIRRFLLGLVSESVREHAAKTAAADAARKTTLLDAGKFKERLHAKYLEMQTERDAAVSDASSTRGELESVKQELAEATASLKVATAENERLWALSERDRKRIEREISMHNRRRAEYEATPAPTEE